MGAQRTPDNLGYYGFNEALNAYYEVISYNKLLSDAGKRNRVLFAPRGPLFVGPVGLAAQAHYREEHPPRGKFSGFVREPVELKE